MELEVGEYVKDNKGNIGKVIGIFDGHCTAKYHIEFKGNVKVKRQYLSTKTITKHSKNIIDLIEVGDYVNGHKVNNITNDEYEIYGEDDWITKKGLHLECGDEEGRIIIENKDIKSIVTKEQFKSIEYRLEE